jgi:hypothetical protein
MNRSHVHNVLTSPRDHIGYILNVLQSFVYAYRSSFRPDIASDLGPSYNLSVFDELKV